MNLEQASLLQTILADPSDLDARLVYADWLEENGAESERDRAEFIRVQIALSRFPSELMSCEDGYKEHRALQRREQLLLTKNGFNWFKMPGLSSFTCIMGGSFEVWLRKDAGEPGVEIPVVIRRGFVSVIRLPLREWTRYGSAIVGAHPIERVELSDCKPLEWHDPRDEWFWVKQHDDTRCVSDYLPPALYNQLPMGDRGTDDVMIYTSPDEAIESLSTACLRWAHNPKAERNRSRPAII